jgi:hypothetical protein
LHSALYRTCAGFESDDECVNVVQFSSRVWEADRLDCPEAAFDEVIRQIGSAREII